jgi:acetyl-CoA carboxylase carboxyltransferase component
MTKPGKKQNGHHPHAINTVASSSNAMDRIAQVSGHLNDSTSNTGRKRSRRSNASELPADYSDILGQLRTLRTSAATPDLNRTGYVRQKQAGKLWVRERVEQLLDPGSFKEVGSVSGTVQWKKLGGIKEQPEDYIPSNNVQGM